MNWRRKVDLFVNALFRPYAPTPSAEFVPPTMHLDGPPAEHEIVWEYDRRLGVRAVAICNAPEGAGCQLGGSDCDCETWGPVYHDAPRAYHEVEADCACMDLTPPYPLCELCGGKGWVTIRHEMGDVGHCNVVEYLNQEDAQEHGSGSFVIARTPVHTKWQGDYYEWELA